MDRLPFSPRADGTLATSRLEESIRRAIDNTLDQSDPITFPPDSSHWVCGWEPILQKLIHRATKTNKLSAPSFATVIDYMFTQVRRNLNQERSGQLSSSMASSYAFTITSCYGNPAPRLVHD